MSYLHHSRSINHVANSRYNKALNIETASWKHTKHKTHKNLTNSLILSPCHHCLMLKSKSAAWIQQSHIHVGVNCSIKRLCPDCTISRHLWRAQMQIRHLLSLCRKCGALNQIVAVSLYHYKLNATFSSKDTLKKQLWNPLRQRNSAQGVQLTK